MSETHSHGLEICVPGNDLDRAKTFLKLIQAQDTEIESLTVEVESSSPLLTDDLLATLTESVDGVQPDETETAETTETVETKDKTESEPTDAEPDPEPTADEQAQPVGDGPTAKLLSHQKTPDEGEAIDLTDLDEEDLEEEDQPTLDDFDVSATFNPDTINFRVCGLLYRVQGRLELGQIHAMLEDTPWESNYNSISAQLSILRDEGLVDKDAKYAGGWQLTERGRQYMRALVIEGDGYPLTVADKISGVHPNAESSGLKAT